MNILDKVEKINTEEPNELTTLEDDDSVLLVLTYRNNEQELFALKKEIAEHAMKAIFQCFAGTPYLISLPNNIGEKEPKVVIRLDNTFRTARILEKEDMKKDD